MPTLQDLLTPQTADEQKSTLLAALQAVTPAFPVTSWLEGGIARTLVELFAEGLAQMSQLVANVAAGGFLLLASGDWLTLVAEQVYEIERNEAQYTQGTCQLAAVPTSSGATITPGQLVATTSSGLRYSNTNGGTLAPGGTLNLTFKAESPGAAYNVGVGTITTLSTPLPGVAINNPDLGGGTWITSQGADEETDASLQARCQARWPSLGSAPTDSPFDLWAKTASATVTRTKVLPDSTTPGQVDVYLAGASGSVGAGTVAAVQAYIDPRVPGPSMTCVVSDSTNEPILVEATLFVKAGYEDTALAAANSNLTAYFNTVDISGEIYESDVISDLQSPTGVRNIELTVLARQSIGSGVGDIDLSAISGTPRVATLVPTLTVVTV